MTNPLWEVIPGFPPGLIESAARALYHGRGGLRFRRGARGLDDDAGRRQSFPLTAGPPT